MANYKAPGVYIEEISNIPASVSQVETAIPAFIGYTEKAMKNGKSLIKIPTRISSLLEYEELFGGPPIETGITVKITDITDNDKNIVKRTIEANEPETPSKFLMYFSLLMYFANGGGSCYIISVGKYMDGENIRSISKTDLGASTGGLKILEQEDEPTLILFPDAKGLGTANIFYDLFKEALSQCHKLQDRFTIIDTYNDSDTACDILRQNIGNDYLKYGAVYYPYLKTTINYHYLDINVTISHVTKGSNGIEEAGDLNGKKISDEDIVQDNNELFNRIKSSINKLTVNIPPSGAIAGVYAKVDRDRGVWKAPANVSLNLVIGTSKKITNDDQEGLNVDPVAGKSINAIRSFEGKGIMVWGARTLAGNDNEWRYISVRRFFNMVEESVKKSTSWAVFEANDANSWVKIRAIIENYLTNLWRQGALSGAKPEEAFYVRIGLGQTMTAQDILEGRMNIEIGIATVRPAEFIILKFSHKMQQA